MKFNGIDEYARKCITNKARQLIGKYGFTESDREDIEQELVVDLLQRLPKFDPSRAKRNTFIVRLIEHKVADIIEYRKAAKRDYRKRRNGVDLDLIDGDDYRVRMGRTSRSALELVDLVADLEAAEKKLPENLREFSDRLRTETILEISHATGIPRTTLYESIEKLRRHFEQAGLRDYLPHRRRHNRRSTGR